VWNDVLHDIRQKIRYRQYPCSTSSVFDTQLFVFVSENIRIRIRSYPYSNSNKNMKTNMVSVISVRIRSDYIPNSFPQNFQFFNQGSHHHIDLCSRMIRTRYYKTQENKFIFHAKSWWKVVWNSKDGPT
jgi:hypothetical protein